jgi:hypothetical protein
MRANRWRRIGVLPGLSPFAMTEPGGFSERGGVFVAQAAFRGKRSHILEGAHPHTGLESQIVEQLVSLYAANGGWL